jgi:hypothetical protein
MDLKECSPDLVNFTKSLLNIGYSHYIAVLDIIDNSIASRATKIWIKYEGDSIIISDNGIGMKPDVLFESMRIASSDPTIVRTQDSDLGKFGLGLKLASFSLSDCFQVISKSENSCLSSLQWDLDIVRSRNSWLIQEVPVLDFHIKLQRSQGTDVIIKRLRTELVDLNKVMDRLRTHIGVVYQRIGGIRFFVGDKEVKMIDPFFSTDQAANFSDPDLLIHKGIQIKTQSFQVPHRDKLSLSDKRVFEALLDIGMSDGIYLFRKNRLIAWSGWEGLGVNKRIGDLQRLAIFIDGQADELFNIEVKKSQISILDDSLRNKIKAKIRIFFGSAKRPYQRRAELSLNDMSDLWKMETNNGSIYFSINRDSNVVRNFSSNRISILDFIKLVESTLPIDSLMYYLNNDKFDNARDAKSKIEAARILFQNSLISKEELTNIVKRYE